MLIRMVRRTVALSVFSVALLVFIVVWTQPALLRVGTLVSLLEEDAPTMLPVPVEQVVVRDLVDTWGAPRSGNRRHQGIDIFAPQGRPVVSTTRGVVFKVGEDELGGQVVRVVGPGWQWHYYAHLDRFANIKEGSIVKRGTVLGYVGNTGNARGTPYHLHYGVYRFSGEARNPYLLLASERKDSSNRKRKRSEEAQPNRLVSSTRSVD